MAGAVPSSVTPTLSLGAADVGGVGADDAPRSCVSPSAAAAVRWRLEQPAPVAAAVVVPVVAFGLVATCRRLGEAPGAGVPCWEGMVRLRSRNSSCLVVVNPQMPHDRWRHGGGGTRQQRTQRSDDTPSQPHTRSQRQTRRTRERSTPENCPRTQVNADVVSAPVAGTGGGATFLNSQSRRSSKNRTNSCASCSPTHPHCESTTQNTTVTATVTSTHLLAEASEAWQYPPHCKVQRGWCFHALLLPCREHRALFQGFK